MKLIRANAGTVAEGRYFDAAGDKRQAFYLDVVETKRVKNEQTQQWEAGDPVWYHARFGGADADWARDTLHNGDSLLLWGDTRQSTREVDGKTYHQTDLFVKAVSFNPHLTTLTVDRSRRQDHAAAPDQGQRQDAAADAEAEQATAPHLSHDEGRKELDTRLGQLIESGHLHQVTANEVLVSYLNAQSAQEATNSMTAHLQAGDVTPAARLYLTSVVDAVDGSGRALSWSEAEAAAAKLPAAPAPDHNWALVREARQDVAQTQPQMSPVGM